MDGSPEKYLIALQPLQVYCGKLEKFDIINRFKIQNTMQFLPAVALTCKWAIIPPFDDYRSKLLKILVTGVAGFIGMHVANRLVERGDTVFGIDNLSDHYDIRLKLSRLDKLQPISNFNFQKV